MEMTDWRETLIPYIQAVEELKVKFKSLRKAFVSAEEHSPIEFVTGRVKTISSILEKSRKKGIGLDEIQDKIEDIAGIRIMCQFVEDIYRVIDIIQARDGKDLYIVEERDYITHRKTSGYRSYHVIIKYPVQTVKGEQMIFAEIQIRTLAMNFWATIEHSLRYKYKQNMPENIQERLNKAAEAAFLLDQEMAEIREEVLKCQRGFQSESRIITDIFSHMKHLSELTPKEKMRELYQKFWELWEEGELENLRQFKEELEYKLQ